MRAPSLDRGMVHLYLRRRTGQEEISYPPELERVFGRTLGVPLFQEQVMELAILAADYTPGEADQLRRSMAAWKRHGGLEPHRERLTSRMLANGYTAEYAADIFRQIEGFGSYGFPESHAASFALLTYASCWLKCHEPAAFAAALINSYPMGFYSPDQILQDARRHRLQTLPVDVTCSDWDCSLEPVADSSQPAIRMGLRMVRGLAETAGRAVEQARRQRSFRDVTDLCLRAGLDAKARECLADAGALKGLAGHRFQARWAMAAIEPQLPLFAEGAVVEEEIQELVAPTVGEDLYSDYASLGTTLGPHPLTLLRPELTARRLMSSLELRERRHGQPARVAGLVVGRQRPGTASGVTFVTLEDEFGMVNVVVWRTLAERQRRELVASQLMRVDGTIETRDGVLHVVAGRLEDISELLQGLDTRSRDFH
nr:OB-fold nucleic acid binding domain-containing protein [uncultured Pseudomonas sp.]